jgi:type III restriction enzyme
MKLKFKVQPYQTDAVEAVVDVLAGQPLADPSAFRMDPGQGPLFHEDGYRNAELALTPEQLLANITKVQARQGLPLSARLDDFTVLNKRNKRVPAPANYLASAAAATSLHLDVEMETGTGKTYCYLKTIFEMNRRFGWSKFIIVVPSIPIREGVFQSLKITSEHFAEHYHKKARFFIYKSNRLHELESFSSDSGINVMVINIQAFNARSGENRRIYEELDDFQSRRPIDVIAANRPIVILDEPQKMEGRATLEALPKFRPMMILRYSATHRTQHCRVHRLDALDAYNQKLVKKIAVRGILIKGQAGSNAYLYLEGIDLTRARPVARIELELRLASGGIRRQVRRAELGANLHALSGELDQYREGFVITQIDAHNDSVEFANGLVLKAGEAHGNVEEGHLRRIQIRETIKAHLERERQLFPQGIKVLSLFFIDEVAKYRDYSQADENGEYARIFEEEYALLKQECLEGLAPEEQAYRRYLEGIEAQGTHNGYFSIDKKTNRLKDPEVGARSVDSDDVDAYDLILKDKESLLTFPLDTDSADLQSRRKVSFIFSHSALREGWDNPNVFVMCMLKHSDNTISRRQEVGRGLRLCVDQQGDRVDHPAIVHDVNVLTVVASESYKDFVDGLQREILENLTSRSRKADADFFKGLKYVTDAGEAEITLAMARKIHAYLTSSDYVDDVDHLTQAYHDAKAAGSLEPLPRDLAPFAEEVHRLIGTVVSDASLPRVMDGRKPKRNSLNENFDKQEFRELWTRINQKAIYRVEFDSAELVAKCVAALDRKLKVAPLQYRVEGGALEAGVTDAQLKAGTGFAKARTTTEYGKSVHSLVHYDLVGKVAELTQLTRKTAADILAGIQPTVFEQFKNNPEQFISDLTRLVKEQKAATVIERLEYNALEARYDVDIFTAGQTGQDLSRALGRLERHVYDYVVPESDVERQFVKELDASTEVVVYAKLPRGFQIPTPVGDYNPDWAIAFQRGSVRQVYFVAETKGSMSSLALREVEKLKIECARKFFQEIGERIDQQRVTYDVVTDYGKLMDIVGSGPLLNL